MAEKRRKENLVASLVRLLQGEADMASFSLSSSSFLQQRKEKAEEGTGEEACEDKIEEINSER